MARIKVQQFVNPGCLGQMAKRYCRFCSEECSVAALCVLMVMGEYMRQDRRVPPSQNSTKARETLPTSPEEPQSA